MSGTGLLIGGNEGGLIVGFASQILILYGLWQTQVQRRRNGHASPDRAGDEKAKPAGEGGGE